MAAEQLHIFDYIDNTDISPICKQQHKMAEYIEKKPKTKITRLKINDEEHYCQFCGKSDAKKHHLVFGTGLRDKADEDNIFIYACSECHVTGQRVEDRIHDNPMAEKLSKMLGQCMWEKNYIEEHGCDSDTARSEFIKRYGRGYI